MGFKAWRNLSVLAFAGVALMGCNNTQKDTKVVSTPPPGSVQSNQIPNGGFSTNNAFPTQPKTPFTTTSGPGSSSQFGPAPAAPVNPFATPQPGAGAPSYNIPPAGAGTPPFGSAPLAPLPPSGMGNQPTGFVPTPGTVVPPLPPSGSGVSGSFGGDYRPAAPNGAAPIMPPGGGAIPGGGAYSPPIPPPTNPAYR
jgi:hypothetical protein